MQRTVTTPADLSGEALEDLKDWLGISRSGENALLMNLIGASLAVCEAYIGQIPVEQTIEEKFETKPGKYRLKSHPVRTLISAEVIDENGARSPLAADEYEFCLDASATGYFSLHSKQEGQTIVLRLLAGLAPNWGALPHAIKQGAIRLAAFQYRDRDSRGVASPPASVTALWRPFRSYRLA